MFNNIFALTFAADFHHSLLIVAVRQGGYLAKG